MEKFVNKWLPKLIPWGFSIYVFYLSVSYKNGTSGTFLQEKNYFLLISILLALFPFINQIKIGNFLKLERMINETKEETKQFKTEIRDIISIMSTNLNTITMGNLSNVVNIYRSNEDIQNLEKISEDQNITNTKEIKEKFILEDEDEIMALARTRIQIEYLLRKIMKRKLTTKDATSGTKYFSLPRLFNMFIEEYPDYKNLTGSFRFVNDVCNAAIHAQRVSREQTVDALDTGARIIGILDKILPEQ